jgi:V/A-type H+-transporting ATPase subunit A
LAPWFARSAGNDWPEIRRATLELMQRERELREIASLVGPEALQDRDRLLLDAARVVRETVLGQSAYDPNDAYSPLEKTYRLAALAHALYHTGLRALNAGTPIERIDLGPARRALASARRAGLAEFAATAAAAAAAVAELAP